MLTTYRAAVAAAHDKGKRSMFETKVKIIFPVRASEFRVTFRGQHAPQTPVIEIVTVNERTHTHEMFATYDPFVGGAYDPKAWFIRMPKNITMREIKAIMVDILPAIVRSINASKQTNLYELICAAEHLTDTVNIAIRDQGYINLGNGNFIKGE